MPAGRGPLREAPGGALARALGVTRVARLTGLDRTGVEVWAAVRPRAHVLQVTNGKGETPAAAVAGALFEAAELLGAEAATADAFGSAAELKVRWGEDAVIGPRALDPGGGEDGWDDVRLAWRAGRDVEDGAPVFVPAHAVHVPPAGGPWLGPALLRWTSNGMGAARDRKAALLHGLLEAIERDLVARALPDGFTEREVRPRLLSRRGLADAAPRTAALADRMEAGGLRVHLVDLSFPSEQPGGTKGRRSGSVARGDRLGLPAAAALLLDEEGGPVPVAAGYACRASRDGALSAALLEAAQSRATEIQGAREDVAVSDRHAAEPLRALFEGATGARSASALPDLPSRDVSATSSEIGRRVRRAGLRAIAVSLPGPPGVAVERAFVPGLSLSELL